MSGTNILGLIPARGGSKGVPGKNMKLLGGKPLIGYTIATALQSNLLSKVIVSTDDEAIADISRKNGASVPFIRPAALAEDTSPTIDTVIHALEHFMSLGEIFDAICVLQPTVPFRQAEDIDGSIRKFVSSGADSLVSVREIPHQYNPHWAFVEDGGGFLKVATGEAEIIPRRQALPAAYHRDGSIYITQSRIVLEQRSLYGTKTVAHQSSGQAQINIDTQEDWLKAEAYLSGDEH